MKQLKSALFALTICLIALAGCKKDKTEDEVSSSFSAKVDGAAKTGINSPTAVFYQSENTVQIVGQFSSTTGISLMITGPKVGTFDVAGDGIIATYQPINDPGVGYMGDTGTIKITEWTGTRIKGTFEFTGELLFSSGRVTVTEGKFDLPVMKM